MQTLVTSAGKLRICLRQPAVQSSSMEAVLKHCRQGESKNQDLRPTVSLGCLCHLLSFLDNMAASLLSTQTRQNMVRTEEKVITFVETSSRKSVFNLMVIIPLNLEVFVNLVKTKTFQDIFSQINRILHGSQASSASNRPPGSWGPQE